MKHFRRVMLLTTIFALMTIIGIVLPVMAQDDDTTTYTSTDRALSFTYPSSLSISTDNGQVYLTTGFYYDDTYRAFEANEYIITFIMPELLSQLELEATAAPDEVLTTLLPLLEQNDQSYAEPEALVLGDDDSVPAFMSIGTDQFENDIAMISIGFPAGTVTLQIITPTGELADNSAAFDIVESINYSEPIPLDLASLQPLTTETATNLVLVADLSDPNYYLGGGGGFLAEPGTFAVINQMHIDFEYYLGVQVFNIVDGSASPLINFDEYGGFEGVNHLRASADGTQLITSHGDGALRWWDSSTGELLTTIDTGFALAYMFVVSSDESMLTVVTSTEDYEESLTLIDLTTDEVVGTVARGIPALTSDGSTLIVGREDGIYTYDTSTLEEGAPVIVLEDTYEVALALSPDDNTLAVALNYSNVEFYDITTGESTLSFALVNDYDNVEHITFTPDGGVLIVTQHSDIAMYDASTGELVRSVEEFVGGWASAFALSADGSTIIFGGYDQLAVWGVVEE